MDPLIEALKLLPHPEGGHYREMYRSSQSVETGRGPRAACTAIYYLLQPGEFSAWHRVASDEIWHHYAGDPLTLHTLEQGQHREQRLGSLSAGGRPQVVIPAGIWQAAAPMGPGSALCGCTVAPGFSFEDFEMASVDELLRAYPGAAAEVLRLARH